MAVRTGSPPAIDGRLDDPAWRSAAGIQDFHMIKPTEYANPSEKSEVYVAYDDEALYIAARFYDGEPEKVISKTMRQGSLSTSDDLFSVIIDPFLRGAGAYMFDLNPNGVRTEALFTSVTERNYNWQGIWQGAAVRDETGWTAEMAIPFKTLSFNPGIQSWGINFSRWIGRKNEQAGWVSRNRSQSPSNMGRLTGLENISQGKGLDVVPSIRVGYKKHYVGESPGTETEPSLDAHYRLSPSVTAGLTINTDFSGTSVDARQIDLTRFGLFFPEKREFFLQDEDMFEFGRIGASDSQGTLDRVSGQSALPFFSRRIGLSPSGEPIDIVAGAKITGRVGRINFAGLSIQQDSYLDLDSQNLSVGRISAHVLDESRVGIIMTNGNPDSNLNNTLAGVDFNYRNSRLAGGKTVLGSLWYQESWAQGMEGDNSAFGGSLTIPNNIGFRGEFRIKSIGEQFNPGLGFVSRTGINDYATEIGHTWRPENTFFRSVYAGLSAQRIEKIDGGVESERFFYRTLELENHFGDRLYTWYLSRTENVDQAFEIAPGAVIPANRYSFGSACASLSTGGQRTFSGRLFACDGSFYDGDRTDTGVDFTWRPGSRFMLTLSYEQNDIALPLAKFKTKLATLQADVAFNAFWSWETFIQHDNVSDSIGLNSILRWIPKAGRELVFVINHESAVRLIDDRFHSTASSATIKWKHTLRF